MRRRWRSGSVGWRDDDDDDNDYVDDVDEWKPQYSLNVATGMWDSIYITYIHFIRTDALHSRKHTHTHTYKPLHTQLHTTQTLNQTQRTRLPHSLDGSQSQLKSLDVTTDVTVWGGFRWDDVWFENMNRRCFPLQWSMPLHMFALCRCLSVCDLLHSDFVVSFQRSYEICKTNDVIWLNLNKQSGGIGQSVVNKSQPQPKTRRPRNTSHASTRE